MKNLIVLLPPSNEQPLIVSHIDSEIHEVDIAIQAGQRQIDLIREYRTRLVADVVTGKLDVRGVELPELEEVEEIGILDNGDEIDPEAPDETEEPAYADD